jgi:hypothetical protein
MRKVYLTSGNPRLPVPACLNLAAAHLRRQGPMKTVEETAPNVSNGDVHVAAGTVHVAGGLDHASPDMTWKIKTEFAEKAFSNAQDLSRMMDQKAGYLLSTVGLLTTALGILASRALDVHPPVAWQSNVRMIGMVTFLAYVICAFAVVYFATRVFQALPHNRRSETAAPGLIFPLILLGRFRADKRVDEEIYFDKLLNVGVEDMLHDLANQIVEISGIYHRKQKQINRSTQLFGLLTVFWVITMLLFLATIISR